MSEETSLRKSKSGVIVIFQTDAKGILIPVQEIKNPEKLNTNELHALHDFWDINSAALGHPAEKVQENLGSTKGVLCTLIINLDWIWTPHV